jgi:hypothetical protein
MNKSHVMDGRESGQLASHRNLSMVRRRDREEVVNREELGLMTTKDTMWTQQSLP